MDWKENLKTRLYAGEGFARFVIHHFIQDECAYIASALAFASLLAVVPLMSVGFTVFSSFPVFQGLVDPVQNFIFENFVPSTGKIIQAYLHQFASQVTKLSVLGTLFLMCTALLVMFTVEKAMNKIWRVPYSRHGAAAFLLYWAILSFAPILLGLSLVVSSYLFSTFLFTHHSVPSFVFYCFPFILSSLGFTFLYVIVPNCTVQIRHAFKGALIAAILFELAKQGFAYFLSSFDAYELLYGAFAAVPLFFIWVYWVWIITLLGAEISYAYSVHHLRRKGTPLDGFSHALIWLKELWKAQQKGRGVSFNELVDANNQPFAVDADEMLNALIHGELIHSTADGLFMLNRDLAQVSLYTLTQLLPFKLPTNLELKKVDKSRSEPWMTLFKKQDGELKETLNISLEELFKKQHV